MKRVVTGYDQDGKSVVVMTDEPPCGISGEDGVRLTFCWETQGIPVLPVEPKDPTLAMTTPFPGPDGTTFVMVRIPANTLTGMHLSDTLDYITILSGEVWLVLDSGEEVLLTPGHCVVQTGTMHAWDNRGSDPCVLSAVVIGARRQHEEFTYGIPARLG